MNSMWSVGLEQQFANVVDVNPCGSSSDKKKLQELRESQ